MSLIYANIIKRASTGLSTLLSGLKIRQWGLFRNTSKDYSTTELGACNGGGMYAKDDLGQVHEFLEASDTRAVIDAKIALALIGLSSSTEYKGAWSSLLAYALNDKVSFVDTENYQYIYTANSAMVSGGESPDVNTAWDLVIASGVPKAVFDVLALVVDGNTTSIASILETLAQFERATGTYTYNAVALSTGQVRMSLTIVTQSTNTDIFDIDATTGTLNINTISNYLNIATLDFTKSTGTDVVATFRIFNQNDVQLGSDYPMTLAGRTDLQRVIHIPIDDRPIGSYYATIQLSDNVPCTLDATSLVSIVAFNASGSSVYLPKTATVNDVEYDETTKNFPVDTLSVNDRLKLDAVPLELDQELEDIVNEVNTKLNYDSEGYGSATPSDDDNHLFTFWSLLSLSTKVFTWGELQTAISSALSTIYTSLTTFSTHVNNIADGAHSENNYTDSEASTVSGNYSRSITNEDDINALESSKRDEDTSAVDQVTSISDIHQFSLWSTSSNKIWVATFEVFKSTLKTYFDTIYNLLSLGETSTTAYRGDRGKTAYDHSQAVTGNPHSIGLPDIVANDGSATLAESSSVFSVDGIYGRGIHATGYGQTTLYGQNGQGARLVAYDVGGTSYKYLSMLQSSGLIPYTSDSSKINLGKETYPFGDIYQAIKSASVIGAYSTGKLFDNSSALSAKADNNVTYTAKASGGTYNEWWEVFDSGDGLVGGGSNITIDLVIAGGDNNYNVNFTVFHLSGSTVIRLRKLSENRDSDKLGYTWDGTNKRLKLFIYSVSSSMALSWTFNNLANSLLTKAMVYSTAVVASTTPTAVIFTDSFPTSAGSLSTDSQRRLVAGNVKQDADCTNYGAQTATRYLVFPCNNAYNSTHENGYLSMNSLASYLSENGDNGLIYTTAVAIMSNLSVSANSLYAEFYRDGTVKFKGALLLNDTYPSSSSYITFVVPSGIVASLDTSLWFPTTIHMSVTTGRNTGYGYFYMFSATALRFKFSNSAEFSTANYWRMGFNTTQINFGHGAFDESVL